ncbi:MAG: porin family protein [Myxococcales bacterium]|nr:porin family protein [Myxococcales bacterium]MCB9733110.1 porin family protein [Deltaproteobacteria bacterium]
MMKRPARGPVAAILTALLAVAGAASPAHAEEDELALTLGAGAWIESATVGDAEIASVAPIALVGLRYGLSDFWQLGGSVTAGVSLSGDHDPAFVGTAHLEAYYFLDVVTWVLYGMAGAGVLVRDAHPDVLAGTASGPGFDLSVLAGLGLDYRPARDWSLGLAIRYHVVVTDLDRTSPTLSATLGWTAYFE